MGHVQSILESMKKKQVQANTAVPAKQQSFDLPGDHRREIRNAQEVLSAKKEYTRCVRWLQEGSKKMRALRAKDKKVQLKKEITHTKAHMGELLDKIGSYSDEEKVWGFKEADNGN
jgi:hypothetical protein